MLLSVLLVNFMCKYNIITVLITLLATTFLRMGRAISVQCILKVILEATWFKSLLSILSLEIPYKVKKAGLWETPEATLCKFCPSQMFSKIGEQTRLFFCPRDQYGDVSMILWRKHLIYGNISGFVTDRRFLRVQWWLAISKELPVTLLQLNWSLYLPYSLTDHMCNNYNTEYSLQYWYYDCYS